MVAVRKKANCLSWVRELVKAQTARGPLGHLQKTQSQRHSSQPGQEKAKANALVESKLNVAAKMERGTIRDSAAAQLVSGVRERV